LDLFGICSLGCTVTAMDLDGAEGGGEFEQVSVEACPVLEHVGDSGIEFFEHHDIYIEMELADPSVDP